MQNCKNCDNNYIEKKPSLLGDPTCIRCGSSAVMHIAEYKSPTFCCNKCGNN